MLRKIYSSGRRALTFLLILSCPVVTGCLGLAAAGAAAGAGAGYVYYRRNVCQDFPADFQSTWAASRATLQALQFPIHERPGASGGTIESETADGAKVTVNVEVVASRIPAERTVTRVCVRVGLLGDPELSQRLLDEIGLRLAQSSPGGIQPPLIEESAPGLGDPRPLRRAPVSPRGGEETAEPPRPKARGNLGTSNWSKPQRSGDLPGSGEPH